MKMSYVVITGASRGIGYAIAEVFAQNGYNLCITSRNDFKLYKAMETLQTKYPDIDIRAKAFDLSTKELATAFGAWCLSYCNPEILINNAGLFESGKVSGKAEGVLENQMATNLYSAYYVTSTVLPVMIQNGAGHIFNICSIASLQAYPNGSLYGISKYALHGFSTNLREELRQHHIKVTSVFPGAVHTDSWEGFDNSEKRIMEATDVAQMIFTASQLSEAACVEDIVLRPQHGDL